MARSRKIAAAPRPRRKAARVTPAIQADEKASRLVHESGRPEIIVRMYRHGLGDCFLLALPTQSHDDPRYLLIDCGVHARETSGKQRMRQVLANIVQATGGCVHVVAATHEHADHLSGFVQKGSPFLTDELRVEGVWLAWTEKRGDSDADRLRRVRGTAASVIQKAVQQSRKRGGVAGERLALTVQTIADFDEPEPDAVDPDEVTKTIVRLARANPDAKVFVQPKAAEPQLGVSRTTPATRTKPSSNELALGLLTAKAGIDKTHYFEPGAVTTIADVQHLRAYVLGPPRPARGEDEDLLRRADPSKIPGSKPGDPDGEYKEVYLSGRADTRTLTLAPAFSLAGTSGHPASAPDSQYPFTQKFRREYKSIDEQKFVWQHADHQLQKSTQKFLKEYYLDPKYSWRRIDGDWLQTAEQLALNLAGDTNNTSLVLALEWGPPGKGQVLLFPGDAQVGNWLSWRRQDYHAEGKTTTADDLLRRTVLYKVGHHGSHNATAKRDSTDTTPRYPLGVPYGLELMNDIIALIPVDWQAVKKEMPSVWKMPYEGLYRRLREKSHRRVLRADESIDPLRHPEEPDACPQSTEWEEVPGLKDARWRRSFENFQEGDNLGPLYYDIAFTLPGESRESE